MNDTLMRQWMILRAIPRHPRRIDEPTIHAMLGDFGILVSLRTLQRDLNALAQIFPLDFDESKPQGGCWREVATQLDVPSPEYIAQTECVRHPLAHLSAIDWHKTLIQRNEICKATRPVA